MSSEGAGEVGYAYQSTGSLVSAQSTHVSAEVSRETSTGLSSLEGCILYGEQNSVRNTYKEEVAFRVREKFKDGLLERAQRPQLQLRQPEGSLQPVRRGVRGNY